MRLICPECAAQYEIADGLIPPEGREVECSACGHGWRQSGLPPLRLSPEVAIAEDDALPGEDAAPPPPLGSRGLSDPILAILREEAERELAARAAERTEAFAAEPDAAGGAAWQAPGATDARAGSDPLPDPHALAASLQWEVPGRPEAEVPLPPPVRTGAAPRPAQSGLAQTKPAPARTRAASSTETQQTEAAALALRQRRAHDRGFAVAMLCALLLVGAYAAAPSLAGRGAAGAQVAEARAAADRGRVWLQAHAESLTDRAVTGVQRLLD